MQHEGAVIHVVAASAVPLYVVVAQALRPIVRIRLWTSAPPRSTVRTGDILLVDLLNEGPAIPVSALLPLAEFAKVWLVTGAKAVATDWFEVARQPGVRIAPCGGHSTTGGLQKIVTALVGELRGPTGEEIAALVLTREPRFAALESLVKIICKHPWEVRHPRQLASLSGLPLSWLKQSCRRLGFNRAEHFIVAVRMLSLEQLVGRGGLPVSEARRLVGIADPSNARRQARRAHQHSPEAFGTLDASVW